MKSLGILLSAIKITPCARAAYKIGTALAFSLPIYFSLEGTQVSKLNSKQIRFMPVLAKFYNSSMSFAFVEESKIAKYLEFHETSQI
jgi:hypothetical protein